MKSMSGANKWVIGAMLLAGVAARAQTFFWNPSPVLPTEGEVQKSYNWTGAADGSGARPASLLDDVFSSAATIGTSFTAPNDTGANWISVDSVRDGFSAAAVSGGKLTLTGRGRDLWAGYNQIVAVRRKEALLNFDVTVKIDSQSRADDWSKAGIIVFNNFSKPSDGGAFVVAVTPDHGFVVQFDASGDIGRVDSPSGGFDSTLKAYPCWLRAVRSGTQFTGYYRLSPTTPWVQIRSTGTSQNTFASTPSQIGLFVCSHNTGAATTVVFSDYNGGGDIQSPSLDLSFSSGPRHNVNARLTADLSAASVDLSNYGGTFSFNASRLTVKGNVNFGSSTLDIDPGTGTLALSPDTGIQHFIPRTGDTLPNIVKTGAGTTQVDSNSLLAGRLTLSAGRFNLNGKTHEFAGFAATGGELSGMRANDSVIFTGDADFTGLATLGSSGFVHIKAVGQGGKTVTFNPGSKAIPNLYLVARPTGAGGAKVRVAGNLNVAGNLVLRNFKSADGDGFADFETFDPAVTVAGNIGREESGATGNPLAVSMGDGVWTVNGNADFALGNGSANASKLVLSGAGAQTLALTSGVLNGVTHSGAGTVTLAAPLNCAALNLEAGRLDLNGRNVNVTGNLSATGGGDSAFINLAGRTIAVQGSAVFAGSAGSRLRLDPASAWTLDVKGSLTADYADIGNSDAGPGSEGQPAATCFDKGGNLHWNFPGSHLPNPAVITREPVDASVQTGHKALFTIAASGAKPFTYQWRKQGDTTVISGTDTLTIDSTALSDNGSLYYCIVSNKDGVDTSNFVSLTVQDQCDKAFAVSADTTVDEGGEATLLGQANCATSWEWQVEGWPSIALVAPMDLKQRIPIPRVAKDTFIVCKLVVIYGDGAPEEKKVKINVRNVIPDPKFTLASAVAWDGKQPLTVRPNLTNKTDLDKFPALALHYAWAYSAYTVDMAEAGDSTVLSNPRESGLLEVNLCVDNGGAAACGKSGITINLEPVSIAALAGIRGPVGLSGNLLVWRWAARVRIWGSDGKLLFDMSGRSGAYRELPAGLRHALSTGRAWLLTSP